MNGNMDDSENAYLANKHRGGKSNNMGNLYENYYAVFSILREMATGHRYALVSAQVEGAYVDDLLIVDGENKIYHQLKNNAKLSWGGMQHGDLKYDFLMQARLSESSSEKFLLKLVVSFHYDKLMRALPNELKKVASVEFYPMLEDFNQYAYFPAFANVAIKAIGCASYEIDKVENVATALLGLWVGGRCRGKKVYEVWDEMKQMLYGKEIVDAEKIDELVALLQEMGFSVLLNQSGLIWKYGGFEGLLRLNNEKILSLLSIRDVEDMIRNLI